jgi:hypothetical protein
MKKRMISLAVLLVFGFLIFYAGLQLGKNRKAEPVMVKETVRAIAVVNLDQGILVKGEAVNYGTQLVSFTSDYFSNTSFEEARNGVENGKYAAYVLIPSSFSENVFSINTSPEKAVLEYAINPNLREDLVSEVIYDLKGFEMKLNTDVSYLYLHSILEEFHKGQESAETVMKHDQEDAKNLFTIAAEALMEPLAFAELKPAREYPGEIQLGNERELIASAADEMEARYDSYASIAKEDLDKLMEEQKLVIEAEDNFLAMVSEITFLEDERGDPVLAEGKNQLLSGLEEYYAGIVEERNRIKEAFQWIARHDSVDDSAEGNNLNTWLSEIRKEQERQREAYQEDLMEWKSSFDYSKLATPSVATPSECTPSEASPSEASPSEATPSEASPSEASPSEATPSEASPSEATPSGPESEMGEWLLDRDFSMVKSFVGGIYERIEEELESLDLGDCLSDVLWIVWQNCMDEEAVKGEVVLASKANPVMGSPEAEAYIHGYFEMMPIYQGSLMDIEEEISRQMEEYTQDRISEIDNFRDSPEEWFLMNFEDDIEQKLVTQEDYLQEKFSQELVLLTRAFTEYQKRQEEFRPFERMGQEENGQLSKVVNHELSKVEKEVNQKAQGDTVLIQKLLEDREADIDTLQEGLEKAYEGTEINLASVLESAREKRGQLNKENESLLSGFTQKLPYTRNGSVANTAAYELITNPVETKEKKLIGRKSLFMTQGLSSGSSVMIGILFVAVLILGIQNERFRRREQKRKKEQEDG